MPRLRCQNREFCTSLKDNSGVIWHEKNTKYKQGYHVGSSRKRIDKEQ